MLAAQSFDERLLWTRTSMAEPPFAPLDDLPQAVVEPPRCGRLPFIWLLPVLVLMVAAFVAIQQKLAQGPLIDIEFLSADGLETNKTKIRYKDVDIGTSPTSTCRRTGRR